MSDEQTSTTPDQPAAPPTAPATLVPPEKAAPPTPAPAKGRDDKGKRGDKKGGGPGGMPRRRILENVPSLVDNRLAGARLRELDDEIAAELESALGGMSSQQLLGAETSTQARQQAAAPGESGRKQGTVLSIHGPDVFIDVPGGRSQGVLAMEQFTEGPPKIGDKVEVSIEGYDPANGLLLLSRKGAAMVADWSSVAEGMIVEARVTEVNKGGLSVDINGIRGFMPISQIDLYRVENAEQFLNQRLRCVVTEVDPSERNLVVSRRALLEKEREEQREKLWGELAEGQVRQGIVRSVKDFGAFVDLGGVDGLLHVSEMSWKRVQDASQLMQPGQSVKVVILKIDHEKRKLSLGMKQLEASPWDNIGQRFQSLQIVPGKVSRVMDFGAFVELEEGVEGLIHVSELSRGKVWRVADIVKPGQDVEVKILSIDAPARRISLSLKDAQAPAPVKTEEEEEEEAVPEEVKPAKPRNIPLRGGVGQESWIRLERTEEDETR